MKRIIPALIFGLFSAQSALAGSCYSYTDYESVSNDPAACLGSAAASGSSAPAATFVQTRATFGQEFSAAGTGDCITQPVAV